MPFGYENAPGQFQRMMDSTFSGLKGTELFVYIDDLVSHAKTLDEQQVRVQRLFNRLRQTQFTLQPEKCKFLCKEVEYLRHIITREGIKPDLMKIESRTTLPSLETTPKPANSWAWPIIIVDSFEISPKELNQSLTQLVKRNFLFGRRNLKKRLRT